MMPPTSKPSLKRLKALLAAEGKCPCFHWRSRPPPGHMGLPWIWKVGRSASLPAEAQQTFRKTTPCSGHCALTSFVPLKFPGSLLLMLTCTFPFCYQICSGVGRFLNLVPSDPDPHTLACPWSGGGVPVVRCHFRNYVQLYTEGDAAGESTFIAGALQKQRMFSTHHRGGTRDLKQKGDLFLPPGPKGEPHLAEHLILAL